MTRIEILRRNTVVVELNPANIGDKPEACTIGNRLSMNFQARRFSPSETNAWLGATVSIPRISIVRDPTRAPLFKDKGTSWIEIENGNQERERESRRKKNRATRGFTKVPRSQTTISRAAARAASFLLSPAGFDPEHKIRRGF